MLAARQRAPPDTDTPRDWCSAQQTSTARLDPEQPQKVGRTGQQGHHYYRPGSCGRPLPAVGRVTTEKSPGMLQAARNPALRHGGDVWWWLPAPTPSGDNSQLCLSRGAGQGTGTLSSGRACPRLRVCPLGCLCRHHFPVSQHGPGALLRLLPPSGVRDKSRPWARYGIPQAGRHAGGLSGHGHPAAVPGHRHTPPGCWHSDEVLSHHRHGARVLQVLCEDTEALLGYRDTRNMCMARGTGAGYSVPVLAEVHRVGCHQDTSAVPG